LLPCVCVAPGSALPLVVRHLGARPALGVAETDRRFGLLAETNARWIEVTYHAPPIG
jgi:hypothetical protein